MAKHNVNRLTAPAYIPRYRIGLVSESRYAGPLVMVHDSVSAAKSLRPFFDGLDREQFLVCCLDAKNVIIGVNVVSVGTLTMSIVHPREVFKPAILLNSCAIICAHNHPSGDPSPSPEDRQLTKRLRQAAEVLGITLLDHIILGEDRTHSFADQGWPP